MTRESQTCPEMAAGKDLNGGKTLIGTASWTDKTLIDSHAFYPKEASSAEERLRFYAKQFPIVEVDSTYYFPPTQKNSALWASRTPSHFTFHIKAYSLLTQHPTRPASLYKDLAGEIQPEFQGKRVLYLSHLSCDAVDQVWSRFADALMPLHSAGKLGVVHFQFPQWFLPGSASRDYLLECKRRLSDYQIAIEFRNSTWLSDKNIDRTVAFLTDNELSFSNVDMPQGFKSSLPPTAIVTNPQLAYVRFHGRNTEQWEGRHEIATPRFAYLY
ncbi:MAG: DUF72 domain-containing protein, partial [Actinobacteria bacterium]|nr:DUF72 domain-containing protein [Actinomycetota bacterium]